MTLPTNGYSIRIFCGLAVNEKTDDATLDASFDEVSVLCDLYFYEGCTVTPAEGLWDDFREQTVVVEVFCAEESLPEILLKADAFASDYKQNRLQEAVLVTTQPIHFKQV